MTNATQAETPPAHGHQICLTIDTDPDGLAGQFINRDALEWKGLERIDDLRAALDPARFGVKSVPITWFVRADGQIRDVFGTALYLFDRFAPLFQDALDSGDEIGWHPHLYRASMPSAPTELIREPAAAADEIFNLWQQIRTRDIVLQSFRNGEGWHAPETFAAVERLGFAWDSTAIPGRKANCGHPLDWTGTPNHPYFPGDDIRKPGAPRHTLEIPMTSWRVKAPYDREPRLRYINPAIHRELFAGAIERFRPDLQIPVAVWTMILHPDEATFAERSDALYAHDVATVCENLQRFTEAIRQNGHAVEFATISNAGARWRQLHRSL